MAVHGTPRRDVLTTIVRFAPTLLALSRAIPCLGEPCPWEDRSAPSPNPREMHAMCFDSAREVAVLFGGWDTDVGVYGDTWEWDGNAWVLRTTGGPSPRYGSAMVYDSVRGVTVLFGGDDNSLGYTGDTWEWNGVAWVLRSPSGPPARALSAMAYDSARGVTVLFGGFGNSGSLGDTWEWDGATWTQRSVSGPTSRWGHAMAFDSARGVTVLFGGSDGSWLGDTWEWDGAAWTERSATGPTPRDGHAMAYDSARHVTVLFGGFDNGIGFRRDTWEWDGIAWGTPSNSGPSPRYRHAMAYDSVRGVTVLTGGYGGGTFGDTWEFGGACAPSEPTVGDDLCVGGTSAGQPCSGHVSCADGLCHLKNRFISVQLPATPLTQGVRVNLVALDANSVASPEDYNGTDRWLGAPALGVPDGVSPNFHAAKVQCAFASHDWSAVGLVHIYGDVVVPQSTYDVSVCSSAPGPCSAPLRIGTARFGDILPPLGVTNFQDIVSIVAKFQGTSAGPSKTRTKLAEPVNPSTSVNFQEVSADVAAFQGKTYKQVSPTPPAVCP